MYKHNWIVFEKGQTVSGLKILDIRIERRNWRDVRVYLLRCPVCLREFEMLHDSLLLRVKKQSRGCVKCNQRKYRKKQLQEATQQRYLIDTVDKHWKQPGMLRGTYYYGQS